MESLYLTNVFFLFFEPNKQLSQLNLLQILMWQGLMVDKHHELSFDHQLKLLYLK